MFYSRDLNGSIQEGQHISGIKADKYLNLLDIECVKDDLVTSDDYKEVRVAYILRDTTGNILQKEDEFITDFPLGVNLIELEGSDTFINDYRNTIGGLLLSLQRECPYVGVANTYAQPLGVMCVSNTIYYTFEIYLRNDEIAKCLKHGWSKCESIVECTNKVQEVFISKVAFI